MRKLPKLSLQNTLILVHDCKMLVSRCQQVDPNETLRSEGTSEPESQNNSEHNGPEAASSYDDSPTAIEVSRDFFKMPLVSRRVAEGH